MRALWLSVSPTRMPLSCARYCSRHFIDHHVQAEELWGVIAGNELINFSSSDPSVCGRRPITGLATGESIVGIDFRPEPPFMRLYALADTGQLYLISNPESGVATPVTPGPPPTLKGTWFGIDFDPLEDRLRVVSDSEQNLRVDPDTGALVATDGDLVYAAGDPNAGMDPRITGSRLHKQFRWERLRPGSTLSIPGWACS